MPTSATRSFRAKHEALYASERHCERYDLELCQSQDYAGELLRHIEANLGNPEGQIRVADIGAGTGKLARLLASHASSLAVVDRSAKALAVARSSLADTCGCALSFHEADLRALPLATGEYDLVIAGWALSYLKSELEEWYSDGSSGGPWRPAVEAAIAELDRLLAPGGTLILLETQGTATTEPQRAGSWLYALYRDAGFEEHTVRTDYRFPSKAVAIETLRFFFGKGVALRASAMLADRPEQGESCIVPECTGMWCRRKRSTHLSTDGDLSSSESRRRTCSEGAASLIIPRTRSLAVPVVAVCIGLGAVSCALTLLSHRCRGGLAVRGGRC